MEIVTVVPQATLEREVYSEWPWSFEVRSTYHNMGLFLDRIRTIPRIVNVSGVVMRSQGDGVTTTVTANFTATTFVYREEDILAGEATSQ
jgi:Tfp pilus assembly protein PilO